MSCVWDSLLQTTRTPPHSSHKPDLFAGLQIEPLLQTLNRPFI